MADRASPLPLVFPNPKVGPSSEPVDSWYRYYAGYSSSFVDYTLRMLAPDARSILDPWNGTGTTTVLAAGRRIEATGYDINPALVVVARGRLLDKGVMGSISALTTDIVRHAQPVDLIDDPIRFWLSEASAAHMRGLQMSVHRLLVNSADSASPPGLSVPSMSTLAAFFYVVLFRTLRILIAPTAGTNPTWWKEPASDAKLKVSGHELFSVFTAAATELGQGLHASELDLAVDIVLDIADSRNLPLSDNVVDAVISSPPYCTRIDYGIATRPELSVLGYSEDRLRDLRASMVGTPTITQESIERKDWGATANRFLNAVKEHGSRASGTYYLKYYQQYYAGMWKSLHELRRVTRPGAPCALVVQDTFYKEILNDTPGILLEMAEAAGFRDRKRYDFAVSRTKAGMNPKARQYRTSSAATESVLVLR
jgi:hypothetical protein